MPDFSIIIPTYNHAHLLKRCLQSVVDQTFSDWEAIVVNNYSSDDTIEVIQAFADERIRLMNFQNNGVIAASRNAGIKAAEGDWVAFLDSDDWWYPDKLETARRYFKDADFIFHDLRIFNGRRKILKKTPGRHLTPPVFSDLMTRGNAISTSGVVARKEIIKKVNCFSEDRNLIAVEDFDLWLRISRETERFVFINRALGAYFLSVSSTSHSSEKYLMNTSYLYAKHMNGLSDSEAERTEAWLNFILGRIRQKRGMHKESKELFWKSFGSRDLKVKLKSLLLILYLSFFSSTPAERH